MLREEVLLFVSKKKDSSNTLLIWVGANQPIHWFLEGKGLGIQQGMSIWVGSPKSLIWVCLNLHGAHETKVCWRCTLVFNIKEFNLHHHQVVHWHNNHQLRLHVFEVPNAQPSNFWSHNSHKVCNKALSHKITSCYNITLSQQPNTQQQQNLQPLQHSKPRLKSFSQQKPINYLKRKQNP